MEGLRTFEGELRRLIEGGELRRAGAALVERHAGEVFGLCQAMVHDRAAAEDLTQDTFSRAFAALGDYRGDASPRTWLLQIARNRCVDHLRARGREPWRQGDGDRLEQAADQAALPAELLSRRREVERALAELSEGERALVVLRFGHGLGYDELASAFGLKQGAVRMRISRALTRMRAALEREELGEVSLRAFTGPAASSESAAAAPAPGRPRLLARRKAAAPDDRQRPLARWLERHLPSLRRSAQKKLARLADGL